jgi:hypothetical protein
MTASDDLVPFLTPEPSNFGYRQGLVETWNITTGANQVRVGDGILYNLPVITQSDLVNIRPGDRVGIIKYNDSYAVLGKLKSRGSAGTPWTPVPLYPQFTSSSGVGSTGYSTLTAGVLASWEGRLYATHHTAIEVDGIWGTASGANTVVYQLQLGGRMVGTWTTVNTLSVGRRGPYDISEFLDQQFLKIELKITSSTGSGAVAHQVLGCYLRQP